MQGKSSAERDGDGSSACILQTYLVDAASEAALTTSSVANKLGGRKNLRRKKVCASGSICTAVSFGMWLVSGQRLGPRADSLAANQHFVRFRALGGDNANQPRHDDVRRIVPSATMTRI